MDQVILGGLREAYASGNLILFVGAGISKAAGLPTWKELAIGLLDQAREANKDPAMLAEVADDIRADRLIDALTGTKRAFGPEEFNRRVEAALTHKGGELPPVLHAIVALKPRLKAVLTTNIDRLLERAFAGEWEDFEDPPGDAAQKSHYILKLHGTLRKHATWVFSRDQYERVIFHRPQLQDTFKSLYFTHPIFFVGFGLADDNIDQTLSRVRALSDGQPPSHYALLCESEVGPGKRSRLEAAGLRLLLYKNADGKHAEVEQVLRSLAVEARPAPASVPDLVTPAPAPRVPPTSAGRPEAPAASADPVRVFVSCAPEDYDFLKRLETHLKPLERSRRIDLWYEGKLSPGEERKPAIAARLGQAEVVLLLLSADFLASDEQYEEMTRALDRERTDSTLVIPILTKPCDLTLSPLTERALWPSPQSREREASKNTIAIASRTAPEQEAGFRQITEKLRTLIDKLRPAR